MSNSLASRTSDHRFLFKPIPNTSEGGCHARVWLPAGFELSSDNEMSVHIMYHGGAFTAGEDSDVPGPEVEYLNQKGVIVVSLQYRLAPHVRFKEISEDLVDGYQWVIESLPQQLAEARSSVHGKLGIKGVSVSGWSAGATATCLVVAGVMRRGLPTPRAIMCTYGLFDTQSVIRVSGLPDPDPDADYLADLLAQPGMTGVAHQPHTAPPTARTRWIMGHFRNGTLNEYLNNDQPPSTYNPDDLITPDWPPTFTLIATKDQLIPPKQSYDYIEALKAAGVAVDFREADMPHGASEVEWTGSTEAKQDYERWFEGAIRPGLDFLVERVKG